MCPWCPLATAASPEYWLVDGPAQPRTLGVTATVRRRLLLARILRAMPDDPLSSRPPLRRAPRTFITALLVLGVVVPSIIIRELIEGTMGSGPLADLGWIAVPMAATAWLAPRASYRPRDALWWLASGFGLYIFVVIAWRVAFLPYRDWPPRPDEASRVRWPRDRQQAGLWYLPGAAK
ncbi:hypothetical protein Nm8I071_22100 [Nonomuraea sp. TT08I-71]|nr:hypothetical protein Nm8I071_22100 [Nonomuraea sp. TT08I-71]